MANRRFNQFSASLINNHRMLSLKAAIGASGAPTISTSYAKGFASITRNSAGNYTLLLQNNYQALLCVSGIVLHASASAAPIMQVISEQVANVTTPQLIVQFLDAAGAAADPDDGATIMIAIQLSDSSSNVVS